MSAERTTGAPRRSLPARVGRVALVALGAAWALLPIALLMLVH